MHRRDFFKTFFATPLLTPYLLGSPAPIEDELFLISDNPELYLPFLLVEMGKKDYFLSRSFAVVGPHPRKTALEKSLGVSGWTKAPSIQMADLTVSFLSLQYPAPPSFTAVNRGKIVDIRSQKLFSLWKALGQTHPRSSCLTIASQQAKRPQTSQGDFVRIFHNGHVAAEMSLKKDSARTFHGTGGRITVRVEGGKAYVPSSSCRHKICCSVPPVSFPAERIVCAPNHLLLEVQGSGPIDTIIG